MDNNTLLTKIISNSLVDTIFQPIADLSSGRVMGYEAFSRGPEGTDFYMPIPLISQARSVNRNEELDLMLCDMALKNAGERGITGLLFMNLDTASLYTSMRPAEDLIGRLSKYGFAASDLVVEFSEKSVLCSFDSFVELIESYREKGFRLCFDNVGSAYSNLFTLGKIRPDFMKIDRNMTQGISLDREKLSKLDMELMIANLMHSKLIAEGVETPEDLRTLMDLGVEAAQGMMIGQPERETREIRPEAMEIIRKAGRGDSIKTE